MHVLGLSFDFHDAAAALVRDGVLLAAAEEERFSRRKHDAAYPAGAIEWCLREAGITVDDLDHVVFYEKPLVKFDRILRTCIAGWPLTWRQWLAAIPVWLRSKLRVGREIQKSLGADVDLLFCEHHLSHAASAFLVSPFEEAAIITADGVGEWTTTAIGTGRGSAIEFHASLGFPHSLGLLYSALTAYLGFRVNDAEWKVMGLAPYGTPKHVDAFRKLIDIREDGSFRLDMSYFRHHRSDRRMYSPKFERLFGRPRREPETPLEDFHSDVAASGQKIIEEVMVRIARHARKLTGMRKLCLAGGVALNCVANWKILQDTDFEEVFIQPAAGDGGAALGAAMHAACTLMGAPRGTVMRSAALGPAFPDDEIGAVLSRNGAKAERLDEEALLDRTARMLADGKVIGWFQGRMEFGPRALGHRSILADARNPAMKDIINAKVKFREAFRPFAPAVPRESAHEWFDMPAGMDLPFMLMVPSVRTEKRSAIPAVTHQDGTGRVQTLTDADNGRFYRLAKRFGALTGVPVLVNTSFNVRGEPIVCTPQDAWNTFCNTGIDALVIGGFIVEEKPAAPDFAAGLQRSVSLEAEE